MEAGAGWRGVGPDEKAHVALEREKQTPRHRAHGRTAGFIFCLTNKEQRNHVGTTESSRSEQAAIYKNTFRNENGFVVISKVLQPSLEKDDHE